MTRNWHLHTNKLFVLLDLKKLIISKTKKRILVNMIIGLFGRIDMGEVMIFFNNRE
jgi:hypothetical protein